MSEDFPKFQNQYQPNMTSLSLSSAAGLLAQLDHTDSRIQAAALARIYPVVDTFWSEIQDSLLAIEGKRV